MLCVRDVCFSFSTSETPLCVGILVDEKRNIRMTKGKRYENQERSERHVRIKITHRVKTLTRKTFINYILCVSVNRKNKGQYSCHAVNTERT